MQHRDDIDGLRAIAVLSVVLFHLGFPGITGGFVGVDVFFVISGYLITGLIAGELSAGRFSILGFYERRVRRIFPALFVVHVATVTASAWLLFPSQASDVGRDVLRSLAFVSNVFFARDEGGYFNQVTSAAPLLHTWSLSVEEQFYIGLPLVLLVLARFGRKVQVVGLGLACVASFALAEHQVHVDARSAFYLVHSRAWELLLGGLLALGAFGRAPLGLLGQGLACLGLGLIVFGVVAIDEETPFPGVWALPPCVGTLLVLHTGSGSQTLVGRLLALRPFTFCGRISYSLYLWHWPLAALYAAERGRPQLVASLALFAASLALATLSYYFVEQPVRRRPYRLGTTRTLVAAALGMAVVGALGIVIPSAAASLQPNKKRAERVLEYAKRHRPRLRTGKCFLNGGFDDFSLFDKKACLAFATDRKNFLVLGDSHAAHFTPALAALRPDINFLQATSSGCQAVRRGRGASHCKSLFKYVFEEFLPQHRVDAVILAGHWPKGSLPGLLATIKDLRPLTPRVIVLGPPAEYDQSFPALLARSIELDQPLLPLEHLLPGPKELDRSYARPVTRAGAEYFSVYRATCPRKGCTLWVRPDVPMLSDGHHLTDAGAELVLKRLGRKLFDAVE
jgi:peptidoglycan/LPS O-acetylase OafA/YrhL